MYSSLSLACSHDVLVTLHGVPLSPATASVLLSAEPSAGFRLTRPSAPLGPSTLKTCGKRERHSTNLKGGQVMGGGGSVGGGWEGGRGADKGVTDRAALRGTDKGVTDRAALLWVEGEGPPHASHTCVCPSHLFMSYPFSGHSSHTSMPPTPPCLPHLHASHTSMPPNDEGVSRGRGSCSPTPSPPVHA